VPLKDLRTSGACFYMHGNSINLEVSDRSTANEPQSPEIIFKGQVWRAFDKHSNCDVLCVESLQSRVCPPLNTGVDRRMRSLHPVCSPCPISKEFFLGSLTTRSILWACQPSWSTVRVRWCQVLGVILRLECTVWVDSSLSFWSWPQGEGWETVLKHAPTYWQEIGMSWHCSADGECPSWT
jgi:hypothetical protein